MINSRAGIRAMKRGLLAVFLVFTISSVTQAGPLNVVIEPYPSISAGLISTSYNASTGLFGATGWALSLETPTSLQTYSPLKAFKLTATIDKSTGVASNGSLTIGDASSPLLTGLGLLGFDFTSAQGGGTLEFLFGVVGGSLASSGVYDASRPLDVQLTVGNTFLGNFNANWNSTTNTALVRSDDPPTPNPEPASLLLVLAAAGALSLRRRKRGVSV